MRVRGRRRVVHGRGRGVELRLRLLHVLRLLLVDGRRLLHVLRLLHVDGRGRGARRAVALETRVVPALVVLSVLVVLAQAGLVRRGLRKVRLRLLVLHGLDVAGRGRGGGGVRRGSGSDGQVVTGGAESAMTEQQWGRPISGGMQSQPNPIG